MTDEENAAPAPETPSAAFTGSGTFLVKERYEIKFDTPLPGFNTNGAVAYDVKDKTNPQRELFALIAGNDYSPRLSYLPYLKSIDHPNILKLVEFGVVDSPADKTQNMALIYRKPQGGKASDFASAEASTPLNAEKFKSLLLSLVSACETLRGYNITHRAIRLDNIFYKDSTQTEFVLGDCLASFPALHQPDAYETIESLICLPQGRGNGSNADDMYACGVAMLNYVLQSAPAAGISTPELIRLKLKKGSFAALTEGAKVNSQYTAPLKALLNDNTDSRWNYLKVYNYFEGKPITANGAEVAERSMRALTINNEKIYSSKAAAIAFYNNPDEAVSLAKNGKLLEWIKNGLENEKLYMRIEKLINQEAQNNYRNLVAQICTLLDYNMPLKVKDFYVFPGGLPKAVFYFMKTGRDLSEFYNFLCSDLIRLWYQEQPSLRAPSNSNEFRAFITRKDYGYGIDRIMYDFDDDLPCVSPLLNGAFVNSVSRVLRALDQNYNKLKNSLPFDHNIIAYLRCKMGKKIDGILIDLNSRQEALQNSAIIRLYANIQNKNGPVQLPNLSQWLVGISMPVIKTFHNLKYRKYLEKELGKTAKSGKIMDIYEILENEEAKQKDRADYSVALKEINTLQNERNRIITGGPKLDEESRVLGIRVASLLAVFTMVASFVFNLIFWSLK